METHSPKCGRSGQGFPAPSCARTSRALARCLGIADRQYAAANWNTSSVLRRRSTRTASQGASSSYSPSNESRNNSSALFIACLSPPVSMTLTCLQRIHEERALQLTVQRAKKNAETLESSSASLRLCGETNYSASVSSPGSSVRPPEYCRRVSSS